MLQPYRDFDSWNTRLGGELDESWESRDLLRERFTSEDLKYHYLKYLHRLEDQNHINTDNNAELLLVKAFERLPRIDTIEYASREVVPDESIESQMPFSAIGRETLCEPC